MTVPPYFIFAGLIGGASGKTPCASWGLFAMIHDAIYAYADQPRPMLVQAAVSDARYLRRCSKNLYATRQWFFENSTFLKYPQNYRLCKTNENCMILQAATIR